MLKKGILILIVLSFPLIIFAGGSGLYLGAGLGPSYINTEISDVDGNTLKLNDSDYGYKFFGGFRGDGSLGIEGGYRDFGNVKNNVNDIALSSKTTGWDVYVLGRFEIAIVDIFAKGGALFWNTDREATGVEVDTKNGTAFAWGFGAGVHFGALGVRVEWENFQVETPQNLSALTLGVTFGF